MQTIKTSSGWEQRDYLLAVLLILALNIGVFHSGLYGWICSPDSYAGNVFGRMKILEEVESRSQSRPVALIGDSTTEEGIDAVYLEDLLGKPVVNLALPGTSPLEWYYFLRSIDGSKDRFETIVITFTPQNMRVLPHEEGFQSLLPAASPFVLIDYLSAFPNRWKEADYFYASFDRIYAYRADLKDLLFSPDRWLGFRQKKEAQLEKLRNWPGQEFDVCQVRINERSGRVKAWGGIKDKEIRRLAQNALNRTAKLNRRPQVSGIDPLNTISKYYTNNITKIVLVTIPFGVHHRIRENSRPVLQYYAAMQALDALPNAWHWDAKDLDLFRDCSNFYDFRHLNKQGRHLFTKELSEFLKKISTDSGKPHAF